VRPRIVGVAHAPRDPATILAAARARLGADARDLGADVEALAAASRSWQATSRTRARTIRVAEALGEARIRCSTSPFRRSSSPADPGLARAGLARGAVALEKPFGPRSRIRACARAHGRAAFAEDAILRIDHFLGKDPVRNLADMRARTAWLEPLWTHAHVRSVQITMAEDFGICARGAFYERVGALRDVFQNHLLAAVRHRRDGAGRASRDGDAFTASRIEALRAIAPLAPPTLVYGQYEAIATSRTWPRSRTWRPTSPRACRSTRRASPACRSTFARASACRSPTTLVTLALDARAHAARRRGGRASSCAFRLGRARWRSTSTPRPVGRRRARARRRDAACRPAADHDRDAYVNLLAPRSRATAR
jgi:glucose-6-phosphate 1-dehydrogenase